ncbi:MAG TPA: FAD binding domain-containing protein [Candidatus Methylomirabilis sp.]|nr:FAD binding domain-containing protein [Candidatus Methylomirabilis sp.]
MQEIEHFTPETLDEAAALLMAADAPWPALAEGTRLVLQVIDSPSPSTLIIDLKEIPELNRLDYDERGGLRVGAAVCYPSLLEFPPVSRVYPILVDACATNRPDDVREHSTIGGILGNTRASSEIVPSLICLRASAAVFGPYGWSEQGVEALLADSGKARIQPGEFVVDVRLPAPPPRSGAAYLRASSQGAADQPMAGIGVFLVMQEDLVTCCGARLVLGPVAGTPRRVLEAERFLAGKRLEDSAVQEAAILAARSAAQEAEPDGPMTKDCLEAIRGATCRAILEALARAHKAAAA